MKKRGFTLIELLIVIAIIGILATIIVINYSGAQRSAKYSKAKSDLLSIQSAAKMMAADTKENIFHYKLNGGRCDEGYCTPSISYANSDIELPIIAHNEPARVGSNFNVPINNLSKHLGLLENDDNPLYNNWAGPYIDQIPVEDPWGEAYIFDPDYLCNAEKIEGVWVVREEEAPYEYGCQGLKEMSFPRIRALKSFGESGEDVYGGEDCVAYMVFPKPN